MSLLDQSRRSVLTAALLIALTFAALSPVLYGGFIGLDDGVYVTLNPEVRDGLSWHGLKWAFTSGYAANWHPLTWLSHMVDVQIYGLQPAGHHLTNLSLHVANALLLFLFLKRTTGAHWRSAFVAALFAWHPLHVESVAWVAERKDVLSTFFFLLTILAYARYARAASTATQKVQVQPPELTKASEPRRGLYYGLALGFFALGLMCKPMLVTLPFVLLLLDVWPLQRWSNRIVPLLLEKLPFLALAVGSSLVTLMVQEKGHAFLLPLPLGRRILNAIASYIRYLGKTAWPTNLSIFYPHPDTRYPTSSEQWPLWIIGLSALGLILFSLYAMRTSKRRPWLLVGWFWYLGTLVPVIGLVQVGGQAIADRYTYIPLIGVFFCCAWAVPENLFARQGQAIFLGWGAVLACCFFLTFRQAGFWHSNSTLFQHALAVTSNNAVAEFQIGTELGKNGDLENAAGHFRAALKADPTYVRAHYSLGLALDALDHRSEALEEYQAAVRGMPWSEMVRNRLGATLWALGKQEEAQQQYAEALRLAPEYAETHYNLGVAAADLHHSNEAIAHFTDALRLEPDIAKSLLDVSSSLLEQGKFDQAQARLEAIAHLYPSNTVALVELGRALAGQGHLGEAAERFETAVRLQPDAQNYFYLAQARLDQGRVEEAITNYQHAIESSPDWPTALDGLAWILATYPNPKIRNGPEAVRLALRACQLTNNQNPHFYETLDAAYAEAGRFSEAITAAEKTKALAVATGEQELAESATRRLSLYRQRQAFHQPTKD